MPSVLASCRDRLDEVAAELTEISDKHASSSPAIVDRIFEAFHEVAEVAGNLGHDSLNQLSSRTETVMEQTRTGLIELSPGTASHLLAAARGMREALSGEEPLQDLQFMIEIQNLDAILQSKTSAEAPRKRLKVLIVEDDIVCRVLLQGLLSKYGDCHIAMNGNEALSAFRTSLQEGKGYDLICMDIEMPELNGQAAVAQIRAIEVAQGIRSGEVKVLMTSSLRDVQTILSSFGAKCDEYLVKPVDGKKLQQRLKALDLIG